MIITIAILTIATIVAALVLAPRLAPMRVVFDDVPDLPRSFGCRMAWLALRTRDTARVVQLLGLEGAAPANWSSGLGTVYDPELADRHIFVTPPVNGWTFVVGLSLPHPVSVGFTDKCTPLILELGAELVEVQYYFSYPLVDLYAWARLIDGKLVRAYAVGDNGPIWNKGQPTREERALGLRQFQPRAAMRGRKAATDAGGADEVGEQHVLAIAERWSLDPTRLEDLAAETEGIGLIGLSPARWRPERLRRAA